MRQEGEEGKVIILNFALLEQVGRKLRRKLFRGILNPSWILFHLTLSYSCRFERFNKILSSIYVRIIAILRTEILFNLIKLIIIH